MLHPNLRKRATASQAIVWLQVLLWYAPQTYDTASKIHRPQYFDENVSSEQDCIDRFGREQENLWKRMQTKLHSQTHPLTLEERLEIDFAALGLPRLLSIINLPSS